LIIPLLASEFTDSSNLPVFENILRQLKDATYLSQIIFGLDGASEADAFLLQKLIQKYGIKNSLIQWNSGPGFDSIYNQLNEAGFHILEPGKGKNMFLSFGIAIALGADSIGLVDADIRTFKRVQLDRLMYPVVVRLPKARSKKCCALSIFCSVSIINSLEKWRFMRTYSKKCVLLRTGALRYLP
jgi:glucosyl-3-phosphoglycerate synthase